jgi:hypothetical protein
MTEWVGVLMLLLGQVTVNVAPDQPLPHVFDDDPLILEFVADQAGEYSATIQLKVEGHPSQQIELKGLALKAGSPYWHSLTDIDPLVGLHQVTIDVADSSGESNPVHASFYRIHRPDPDRSFPLTVHLNQLDEALLARHLPAKTLRIDHPISAWNDWVTLAEYHQLHLEVCIDPLEKEWSPIRLETAADRLKDRIEWWVIGPSRDIPAILNAAQSIRRGHRNARIALAVKTPNDIGAALNNDSGIVFEKLVVRSPNVPPDIFRSMLEILGKEDFPVDFDLNYVPNKPAMFLDSWTQCLRVNAQPVVRRSQLENSSGLAPSFSLLNAWVRRFERVHYAGPLRTETDTTHSLFRIPGIGDASNLWMAVVSPSGPSDSSLSIEPNSVFDFHFNAYQLGSIDSPVPFLTGSGAEPLAGASWERVSSIVDAMVEQQAMMNVVSDPVRLALNTLREGDGKSTYRRELFQLLQALPVLEAKLRAGLVPKELAIPISSGLGKIAEGLALLEESLGDPFLEPLSKILAQCADYQSRYITQSGGMDEKQRSKWLLQEVNRLLVEVDSLHAENRLIQATALATLAEWRARSLISDLQ